MEKSKNNNFVTVQEVMTPVPAAECSEQAGYPSSSSSVCNVTPVTSLAGITDNATSNNKYVKNPFQKANVVKNTTLRKCINEENSGNEKAEKISFLQSKSFVELGELIVNLMDYVKNRNNVHHAIKEQIRTIRVAYNKALDEMQESSSSNCNVIEKATQTTPKTWPGKREPKRKSDKIESAIQTPMPKRTKSIVPKTDMPHVEINNEATSDQDVKNDAIEKWVTKTRRKRTKLRKPRPDKIIISAKGETSYADILKKIRTNPELKDLGDDVTKVRRTQKGDLLLELKSSSEQLSKGIGDKIENSLDGCVKVRTRTEEYMILCRDMDGITTKAEICEAFAKELELPELDETIIKSMWKSYGGTQSAKLILPLAAAKKALELGKIKIVWSICRIREAKTITKCFRCLEFNHTSRSCKSNTDRSNHCIKCGTEGHLAKDCIGELNCMLCKARGDKDLKHVAGSYRCPVFQKALNTRTE